MQDPLPIRRDIVIPPDELWETTSRSGGPGGQHVNTTNSRVTLHWRIAETAALPDHLKTRVMARLRNRISGEGILQLTVDEERSLHANRRTARERLADLVRSALVRPKPRISTKTPKRAVKRRLAEKSKRGHLKKLRGRPTGDD